MESGLRPGTWNIDTVHSQVMVSVWHFNVANLRAKFPGVRGSLEVNAEDSLRSRFRAEIVPRISDFVLSNNTRGPRSIRRSPAAAVAAEPGMTNGSQPLSRASPASHTSSEPPATVTG